MKHQIAINSLLFAMLITMSYRLYAQQEVSADNAGLNHVGHFLFRVPEGWKPSQQGDQFSMMAPDLGPDELLSFVLMTPTSDTNFQTSGDAMVIQLAAALNAQPMRQPPGNQPLYVEIHRGRCLKGWDYSFGNGKAKISYRNPKDGYMYDMTFTFGLFLAKINGRMERGCYISKDFKCGGYAYAGTTTADKWTYGPVVNEFFYNLEFDDWKDVRSRSGKVSENGISSIWTGLAYMFTPSFNSSSTDAGYRTVCFILFDNGQVYYNIYWPPYGLQNLNTIAAAAADPQHWGTYTWQDGSGVIRMPLQTIPFSMGGGKLTARLNGSTRDFERVPPMEDMHLNGTWSEFNSTVSITFSTDGRFRDHGLIRALEHRTVTCSEGLPEKGEGTYEIRNHSIVFRYDDGLVTRATMPGIGLQKGNESPDKLFLGWQNDVLEKK